MVARRGANSARRNRHPRHTMNWQDIVVGLLEFAVVLALAAATVRSSLWALDTATPQLDEPEEIRKGNLAVALTYAASLLASSLVVRRVIEPSVFAAKALIATHGWAGVAQALVWLLGQAVLALLLGTLGLLAASRLVHRGWRNIDVQAELAAGNVAVAVVVGAVTVALGLFLADGAAALADGFAPAVPFARARSM